LPAVAWPEFELRFYGSFYDLHLKTDFRRPGRARPSIKLMLRLLRRRDSGLPAGAPDGFLYQYVTSNWTTLLRFQKKDCFRRAECP